MNAISYKLSATLMTLVLTIGVAVAQEADRQPPEKVSKFMRAKLVYSQKLLEALALEDFPAMAKNAQDLKLLSQESIWNVLQTEQYILHSDDFRRRTDALIEAAKKKNLDGASLAYVELTLNCVQCHKYVRDQRNGKTNLAPDDARPGRK